MASDAASTTQHEVRRAEIVRTIPAHYSAALHFALPSSFGIAVMAIALSRLHAVTALELLAIPVTLLAGFGLEWRAHKFVLHRKTRLLRILYVRHELTHHVIFTCDDMAMRSRREAWLILMPPYAIVMVFVLVVPFAVAAALLASTNTAMLVVATSMLFFLSYEWLHLAYHQLPQSFVGRIGIIRHLRELHRRHHDPRLMKRYNFNVTVPVFDLVHKTRWTPEREERESRRRGAAEVESLG